MSQIGVGMWLCSCETVMNVCLLDLGSRELLAVCNFESFDVRPVCDETGLKGVYVYFGVLLGVCK